MTPGSLHKSLRWPVICATVILPLVVGLLTVYLSAPAKPKVMWDTTSGSPVPPDFLLAMVPGSSSVPLYDAPNGTQVGTLNRAMLNTWAEVHSDAWFSLGGSTPRPLVRAADLKLADSENDRAWLSALDIAARTGTALYDTRSIHVNFVAQANRVAIEVVVDRHRFIDTYEYDVLNGIAVPKRMKSLKIGDEITARAAALGNGVCAALATAGGLALLFYFRGKQRRLPMK